MATAIPFRTPPTRACELMGYLTAMVRPCVTDRPVLARRRVSPPTTLGPSQRPSAPLAP